MNQRALRAAAQAAEAIPGRANSGGRGGLFVGGGGTGAARKADELTNDQFLALLSEDGEGGGGGAGKARNGGSVGTASGSQGRGGKPVRATGLNNKPPPPSGRWRNANASHSADDTHTLRSPT